MGGLVDANLLAEYTQRGRQIHSIRDPNLQHPSLTPTTLPMNYAAEAADTVSLTRNPHRSDPDSSDSESETEPQSSGDEQSNSVTLG